MIKRIGYTLFLVTCVALSAYAGTWMPPAPYATEYTLYFDVYDSNSPWRVYETAPAAADVHVFQNGSSEAQATNAVTDLGRTFSLVLTASEMTARVVTVDINDATDPPAYGDAVFYIPTYGNASAYVVGDFDNLDVALSDMNSIITDINDTVSGLAIGTIDVNISAASLADAVWGAATADYTGETTFGGELGTLDPNITLIKAVTDDFQIVVTTVASPNDANSFTLTAGQATDDAYYGSIITVWDAGDAHGESRMIAEWTSARVVTVDEPFSFTPAGSDVAIIWKDYFTPSVYDQVREPPDTTLITIDRRAVVPSTTVTNSTKTIDHKGNAP